jgi:hypothetical protein
MLVAGVWGTVVLGVGGTVAEPGRSDRESLLPISFDITSAAFAANSK